MLFPSQRIFFDDEAFYFVSEGARGTMTRVKTAHKEEIAHKSELRKFYESRATLIKTSGEQSLRALESSKRYR